MRPGDRVPYRTGRSDFGDVHTKAGGSRKKTENHETTDFAKKQWQAALNGKGLPGRFGGGRIYSAQYETPGGTQRTMCVIVDSNDYIYSLKNFGYKGIITAFWINGHVGTGECNSSPDD